MVLLNRIRSKLERYDLVDGSEPPQLFDDMLRDGGICAQKNDVAVALFLLADLHPADVDGMFAEGCADFSDRTRSIDVVNQREMPLGNHLEPEGVDPNDSRIGFPE